MTTEGMSLGQLYKESKPLSHIPIAADPRLIQAGWWTVGIAGLMALILIGVGIAIGPRSLTAGYFTNSLFFGAAGLEMLLSIGAATLTRVAAAGTPLFIHYLLFGTTVFGAINGIGIIALTVIAIAAVVLFIIAAVFTIVLVFGTLAGLGSSDS